MLGFNPIGARPLGSIPDRVFGFVWATASTSGLGTAIGYGALLFFPEAELACVHQELRTVFVASEDRTAIIPRGNRVYETLSEDREATTENRKRDC